MIRMLQTVLVVVMALSTGCATTARAPDNDRSMMAWRVTGGGLTSTSYVVGSFHLARDTSWLVPELDAALAASDHVAFELDSKAHEEEVQAMTLRDGMYPEGENIAAHLPAPLAAAVLAEASKQGLPNFVAERMKPWLLTVLIPVMAMQKEGYDPAKGVDQVLIARAKERNKHIVELEKIEDQLSLLSSLPDDLVQLQLERMVMEGDNGGQELAKLSQAWSSGDAPALTKLLDDERKREPRLEPFMRAMFDTRNDGMMAQAVPLMKSAPTMVVVGAGHLLGARGLVKQLQDQGFVVEQMTAKGAR
jgi:uncharacterized protein